MNENKAREQCRKRAEEGKRQKGKRWGKEKLKGRTGLKRGTESNFSFAVELATVNFERGQWWPHPEVQGAARNS